MQQLQYPDASAAMVHHGIQVDRRIDYDVLDGEVKPPDCSTLNREERQCQEEGHVQRFENTRPIVEGTGGTNGVAGQSVRRHASPKRTANHDPAGRDHSSKEMYAEPPIDPAPLPPLQRARPEVAADNAPQLTVRPRNSLERAVQPSPSVSNRERPGC
jgi:hypothetical protein